jgi:hypothetical protein
LNSPRSGPGTKLLLNSLALHEQLIETVAYPRAESVDHFARGNAASAFSFVVLYEFATVSACAQWTIAIGDLLAGKGDLQISHDGGGQDELNGCVWQRIQPLAKTGIIVPIEFTFIGGKFNA